ncbi:SGNH/GDSL hydrolase family protein [Sphingomonas sp.]|uniref:SGNH/GDSL hydrolase family protein n=1 Tax=Sphingomonas sp. TaxID=28214 RepID=UPI000DB60381|nr:SGNH/GDSL hydrolase family protein [Sphingomonas sp.]PZU10273.1 MAG: hypothetical protein DI605_06750 [Sphingomonas sp.]
MRSTLRWAATLLLALFVLCVPQIAAAQSGSCAANPSITGRPCAPAVKGTEWLDFRQDGQAVTARLGTLLNGSVTKLQRAAARAAANNAEDGATSSFTVSLATAEDSGTYSKVYNSTSTPKLPDVMRVSGAVPYLYTNGTYFMPSTNVSPGTVGNLSGFFTAGTFDAGREATVWRASVQTDTAAAIQIRVTGTSSTHYYRLQVDGQYINKTPQAFVGAGNADTITVTLDGQPHVVTLESSQTVAILRIRVAPTATLSRPVRSPDSIVALVTGDSYSEGFGSQYRFMGAWPATAATLLGVDDMRIVALGGTGYIQTNSTTGAPKIADQVAVWKLSNPDLVASNGAMSAVSMVINAGGYNDWSNTSAAIAAAGLDAWTKERATAPNALIVVTGPWAGVHGEADTKTLADEAALKAAFLTWADPNSLFVPINSDPAPWITGTGKVGGTTGDGNADTLMANESPRVHPSFAGHQWIARRVAAAIRAYLAAPVPISFGLDLPPVPAAANDNAGHQLAA